MYVLGMHFIVPLCPLSVFLLNLRVFWASLCVLVDLFTWRLAQVSTLHIPLFVDSSLHGDSQELHVAGSASVMKVVDAAKTIL